MLSNVLGGAFCPGAEACWIMRNPAIYWEPYRIKADRSVADFLESAAQVNQTGYIEKDYTFNVEDNLSQDSDFDVGLQPGDITKYSAVPWQADFNECTTNPNDVTYADWNLLYPDERERHADAAEPKVVTTMWWPAHRPLQYGEVTSIEHGTAAISVDHLEQGHPADQPGRSQDGDGVEQARLHHPQSVRPLAVAAGGLGAAALRLRVGRAAAAVTKHEPPPSPATAEGRPR